jgi:hypothetical protein
MSESRFSNAETQAAQEIARALSANNQRADTRIAALETNPGSRRFSFCTTYNAVHSGTLVETTRASVILPANTFGPNSFVEVEAIMLVSNGTGVAQNLSTRTYFGAGVITTTNAIANGTFQVFVYKAWMAGQNLINSQYMIARAELVAVSPTTAAVAIATDASLDQTLRFTLQHGTNNAAFQTTPRIIKLGYPIVSAFTVS